MWPFRRRKQPTTELVRIGDLSTDPRDYPVLTVGQSRLRDSFRALGFTGEDSPTFTWSALAPIVDPRMKTVADVTISVDGHVIGYLRPPALDQVIDLLQRLRAASLEVPAALVWGPTGPEAYLAIDPDPDTMQS